MSGSTVKAPWALARSAQAAIAAASVVDVFRVVDLRGHLLHPQNTSAAVSSGWASRGFVYVVTLAAVLFLVWFFRCRRNAELLSPRTVRGSAAWAVCAWLIPVINMWAPRGLALDVQRASSRGTAGNRDRALVNVWWSALIGHALVESARAGVAGGTSLALLLASETLELAAGALAIAFIQHLTARQATALTRQRPVLGATDLRHLA